MINKLKSYGRLINWCRGVVYDFVRFYKYGGWKINLDDKSQRNYYAAKVYHGLEKSLSFTNRNEESGWQNAFTLTDIVDASIKNKNFGFHDSVAISVLKQFLNIQNNKNTEKYICLAEKVKFFEENCILDKDIKSGVINVSDSDINESRLVNPEKFFNSRYSIREFSNEKVKLEEVTRAVSLALKTPSACNRQPWHVYHISEQSRVKIALSCQTGNRGFDHKIQDILIVCSDIRAFNPGNERYQHWIDGGMYVMSLIYSLHSIGIASCCLNWSCMKSSDVELRKYFPEIAGAHTVIAMIAIGYPDKQNRLCASPRRPIDEVLTTNL